MAQHRICVNEVTVPVVTDTPAATATALKTPVDVGALSDAGVAIYNTTITFSNPPVLSFSYDANLPYKYLSHGATFTDSVVSAGNSGSLTLPAGLKACCSMGYSVSSSGVVTSLSVNSTTVTGDLAMTFAINNVCIETSFTVNDTNPQ